jgi:FkbM family methyltransferase
MARYSFPKASIFSFEPLPRPVALFHQVFAGDASVVLHNAAVGPKVEKRTMHIAGQDDSSSLLPISSLQAEIFPGTSEDSTIDVKVGPLSFFVRDEDIIDPSLLKLDVQGFELDALRGCEALLGKFEWVYCECSFVELYTGQSLAADIIQWLSKREFRLKGIYNLSYDRNGGAIQADFLFRNITKDQVGGTAPVQRSVE